MRRIGMTAAAALLVAAIGSWARAQEPGPGEKVGRRVDEAGQAVRKGLRKAGSQLRQSFAEIREDVHQMGVGARVYGRLHWDKALGEADIDVDGDDDGVITLKGAVPDAAAKAKAVSLARDTVGVTQVVDQLTVGAAKAARPATAPTPNP